MVNASDSAMGAVVQQQFQGGCQSLAFFRGRSMRHRKYSAYDRELWAAYSAVRYFRHAVEGLQFTIYADHALDLVCALNQKPDKCTPMQFRHLSLVA